MTDVESRSGTTNNNNSSRRQRNNNNNAPGVNNPYSSVNGSGNVPILPKWHPLNVLRRCLYMGISIYGLHYFDTYTKIMKHPDIRHEWFKIGLASSVAILFIKSYVEMFEGKIKKLKVEYKNYPQTTHMVLFLLILTSISFHLSLWNVFGGGKTMLIMFLFGMFLLNFCLLFPTYIQNITAFAILTFFLQEYK